MRTIIAAALAGSIAFAIDFAIGAAGMRLTRVPLGFPPFTLLPILAGTFGGSLFASLVYVWVKSVACDPSRAFFFIGLAVFAFSLGLPLRLSFTRSARFAGVTPSAQMMLVLMHAVVASVAFVVLTVGE